MLSVSVLVCDAQLVVSFPAHTSPARIAYNIRTGKSLPCANTRRAGEVWAGIESTQLVVLPDLHWRDTAVALLNQLR